MGALFAPSMFYQNSGKAKEGPLGASHGPSTYQKGNYPDPLENSILNPKILIRSEYNPSGRTAASIQGTLDHSQADLWSVKIVTEPGQMAV